MPVAPVNVARVSHNLRAFNLLNTVRANQVGLFRVQNQIATGLRFQAPSEDAARAAVALALQRKVDTLQAVQANLATANATLAEGEQAMQDAIDLLREAHTRALETVGDTSSPEERKALGTVVQSLLNNAVAVANRKHLGSFLFSGNYGANTPFELGAGGVLFRGDGGRRQTIVDSDLTRDFFTISGRDFFQAASQRVVGARDLDPRLDTETRLADLAGAAGQGVRPGAVLVSDGAQEVKIDLSSATTVGDIVDRLNAEMPAGLAAVLTPKAINVVGGPSISVKELPGGTTATDLGIRTDAPVADVFGHDLNPRITERTRLSDLNAGVGVDLTHGLTIRNGSKTVNFDFGAAATVEDVLNAINHSPAGVWARITDDGTRLEVLNRVSGSDLHVEERGGQAATQLGIRSMSAGVRVADLNDGAGVTTVAGDDFRISTASGARIDVDLDALDLATATVQDVLNLINTKAGGSVTAALNPNGNGIVIRDNTSGVRTLRIERLNVSPAIDGLGLNVSATGNQLVGRDVDPIRVDSAFTAMVELRNALEADDRTGIQRAAERLDRVLDNMLTVQGQLASQARGMRERTERVEAETSATTILLSDTRDVDLPEAVVRYQQMQTALQANFATAARLLGQSLLDYLR